MRKINNSSPKYLTSLFHIFLALFILLGRAKPDPEPLQDYCVADTKSPQTIFLNGNPCIDPKHATSSHFVTSLSDPANSRPVNQYRYNVSITTIENLPGLNTLGLVTAQFDIAANGYIAPHSHPRASEVIICLKGTLLVGFIDTSDRTFIQDIEPGESFVFPKGLVHFIYNRDDLGSAKAISGLNSQNPGTQLSSLASFAEITDFIPKKAFKNSDFIPKKAFKNSEG